MITDTKFDGRRNGRFIDSGQRTNDQDEDESSGVEAPEAICLGMFAAIHTELKVIAADIGNAYLHAKINEKLYTGMHAWRFCATLKKSNLQQPLSCFISHLQMFCWSTSMCFVLDKVAEKVQDEFAIFRVVSYF